MQQRQKQKGHGRFRKKVMRLFELSKKSAKRMLLLPRKRKELDNALWNAASNGDNESIKRLLKAGASIKAKDSNGWTALINAAVKGHTQTCAFLIQKGADVNATDKYDEPVLHKAAEKGHTETCALLIEKGANLEAKDINGMTALMWTTQNKHPLSCALLIEKGANLEATDYGGQTAFSRAEERHQDKIAAFLKHIKILQGSFGKNIMRDFLHAFRECIA